VTLFACDEFGVDEYSAEGASGAVIQLACQGGHW
jgi:hypothetical protein